MVRHLASSLPRRQQERAPLQQVSGVSRAEHNCAGAAGTDTVCVENVVALKVHGVGVICTIRSFPFTPEDVRARRVLDTQPT